jgi:type IV pilus assembly protein PilC
MPLYIYEALNEDGNLVRGVLDAENRLLALNQLKQYRFKIQKLQEQTQIQRFFLRLHKVSVGSLAIFTRQLATMLKSGLPLVRCLEVLSARGEDRRLENIILLLREQIKAGSSLSQALGRYPEVFNPVYMTLVRAGEISGELPEILDRLATYEEKEYALRAKVRASLTYPILVFVFCVLVATVLILYIFPEFIRMFEGFHLIMPWPTRILILFVDFFKNPWVLLILLSSIGAFIFLFSQYMNTYIGRKQVHHWLIRIPVLGSVIQKVAISRFCRTFSTLFGSGVPILQALDIVSRVTGNEIINDAISHVQEAVKYGSSISAPLEESGFFPPLVVNLIQVGEKTGYLHKMLDKIADFYEMEVDLALSALIKLMEPVLIGMMGLIVGFVLLSIFAPIYQLIGSFSR